MTRACVSGAAGAARAVQLAVAGITGIDERGNGGETSRLGPARARNGSRGVDEPFSENTRYLHNAPLVKLSASTSAVCWKTRHADVPGAYPLSASQRVTRSGGESPSTACDQVLTRCPPSTLTAPWRARPRLAETSVAVGTFLRGRASPRRGRDGLRAPRRNGRPATRRARGQTRPRPSRFVRRASSTRPAAASPAGAWCAAPRPASGSARRMI